MYQFLQLFREDGVILPREIILEDGRHVEIDRIADMRQAASLKVGGQGDRYTIWVGGKQNYLFFERSTEISGPYLGRWFIEATIN